MREFHVRLVKNVSMVKKAGLRVSSTLVKCPSPRRVPKSMKPRMISRELEPVKQAQNCIAYGSNGGKSNT